MQDLSTFSGAFATFIGCNTLNDRGEATGATADMSGNMRAILWRDNSLVDLNSFIPADLPLYLTVGSSMDNSGQIVGNAIVIESALFRLARRGRGFLG
jgi:hypothetical protein